MLCNFESSSAAVSGVIFLSPDRIKETNARLIPMRRARAASPPHISDALSIRVFLSCMFTPCKPKLRNVYKL